MGNWNAAEAFFGIMYPVFEGPAALSAGVSILNIFSIKGGMSWNR
jgi:hypothetical protein